MSFRFALDKFVRHPEKHPEAVIRYDAEFVLIRDAFPKSLYHWLLLPRDSAITKQHPLKAFKDPAFKARAQKWINDATDEIVTLLKNQHGVDETTALVRAGCHAVPSMNNLHIHIISQDFNGDRLKNRHHYNSFTTEFFVPFEDLPLDPGDKRLDGKEMEHMASKGDMICINCGKNFINKFADLKRHLHEEFKVKYKS